MAHRHLSMHPMRLGALCQRGHLNQPLRSTVVEMNVDANPMSRCNGKQDIELAIEVAVNHDWINTTNEIGSFGNRPVQERLRSRTSFDPTLRERNDL